jgi:hypothetical protein
LEQVPPGEIGTAGGRRRWGRAWEGEYGANTVFTHM